MASILVYATRSHGAPRTGTFASTVTPGHIATDLNGHIGTRTVERGARAVVEFAMLPGDGPNGASFNEEDALAG